MTTNSHSRKRSCPHCGHRWIAPRTRGKPRTCFFTAFGQTKHADDWAADLDVSVGTVKNYARKCKTFEEAVELLRAKRITMPTGPLIDKGTRIVVAGNHAWRVPLFKERKTA